MLLKELIIKNFRSFGQNYNKLSFNTISGDLSLIVGKTGSGKSSIINAIDFNLYKKVKGRKKMIPLKTLPNRINGNLETNMTFINDNDTINIQRNYDPEIFKIFINNEEYLPESPNKVKQEKLEEIINFEYESWKTYISLSINDFKDFLYLSNDDKKLLLDKLMNLTLLKSITEQLKEKKKQLSYSSTILDNKIASNKQHIANYQNLLNENNNAIITEISKLDTDYNSEKDNYIYLKTEISDKTELKNIKQTESKKIELEISKNKYELSDINKKIEFYNHHKCPYCLSELSDGFRESFKSELTYSKEKIEKLLSTLTEDYNKLNIELKKLENYLSTKNNEYTSLKNKLSNIKNKKSLLESKDINIDVVSINKNIESLITENTENNNIYNIYEKELFIVDESIKIFTDNTLKKRIIKNIINPLNSYIQEIILDLRIEYDIILDDSFNAEIRYLNEPIDLEEMSNGEIRKINVTIMLAYIRLIRSNKHINILFLDEVFSSIDVDNINEILIYLRKFARKYKINIFLIHHAVLEETYFDRILKIDKNPTSNIVIIK